MRRVPATALAVACGLLMQLPMADAETAAATGGAEVFTHPAEASTLAALLGNAVASVRAASALRGAFTQRKYLHELPQPLVSSGDFLVARGLGVAWHTQKPFDSEIVLTPQSLIQYGADGKAQRVDAGRQAGLGAVSQVFDALFALDLKALAQRFSLFGEKAAGNAWTMGLVPREPAFAQSIGRIVVSGAGQPQRITLYQAAGDRTEIDLIQVEALAELPAGDRKRFEP